MSEEAATTTTSTGEGQGAPATTTPENPGATGGEGAAAGIAGASTPAAGPSLAEVQREKFEALKLKNASKKAKLATANLSEREKALAEQETSVKSKLASYKSDPVAALVAAGYDPIEALDALSAHATSTVEPATKADLKKVAELEAKLAKLEADREAERTAREQAEQTSKAAAHEKAANEAFLGVLKGGEKYKPLEVWGPEELIAHANQIAITLQQRGKKFTFTDVADELLEAHSALVRRFSPAAVVSPSASDPAPATVNGGRPAARTTTTTTTAQETTRPRQERETQAELIERLAREASVRKLR